MTMNYRDFLSRQIGKECTFSTRFTNCVINFGTAEPFSSEGIIDDVTDDFVVIKSRGATLVFRLENTSISY